MRRVSKADLKENSERYAGSPFLEPREWLDNAILGKCVSTGGIIYDYDDIVEAYMVKDGIDYHMASMAVDFTLKKMIDSMPEPKPIIDKNPIEPEQMDTEGDIWTDDDE